MLVRLELIANASIHTIFPLRRLIYDKVMISIWAQSDFMEQIEHLRILGLFDARVPRYTSYPTAAVFTPQIGVGFQMVALRSLDP